MIETIISGGQTGVDTAALDTALYFQIKHGGWCPRGRSREDGKIPSKYNLKETLSEGTEDRTRKNILSSDASLIILSGPQKEDGTRLSIDFAKKSSKPILIIDLLRYSPTLNRQELTAWIHKHDPAILNVGGPRESTVPGIYRLAFEFLTGWVGMNRELFSFVDYK